MIAARPAELRRNRHASRRIDLSPIREALKDRRCWACAALVVADKGESHFEKVENDIVVEVEAVPSGVRMSARLGASGGYENAGVWAIPPVGTEVLVVVPDGDVDFMPMVVGTFSSGQAPSILSEGQTLVHNPDNVTIEAPEIKLGDNASDNALKGQTYNQAINTLVTAVSTAIGTIAPAAPVGGSAAKAAIDAALLIFNNVDAPAALTDKTKVA